MRTSASFGGTRLIEIFVGAPRRRKAWGGRWNMSRFIFLLAFAKDLCGVKTEDVRLDQGA